MRLPWQRKTESMAREFALDSEDANRMEWAPETDDEEPAADADDAPEGAAEPALPDLDDDTRAQVEAYYQRRQERMREAWQAYGLDVAADGQPVIRDPSRFAQWSGARAQPVQQTAPQPQPTPPAEEPLPELDPLSMTGNDLLSAIEKVVQKATAPLLQQNQALQAQIRRQSARDALGNVRQALEQYAPEIAGIVDHPEFAAAYQEQAQALDPRQLEDPRLVAAMAAGLRPYLAASPGTPPGWSPAPRQPQQQQPAARDEQGRFVAHAEVARNMANRQGLERQAPARSGMAPPGARDPELRQTQSWVDQFKEYAPGKVSKKSVSDRDIEAVMAPSQANPGQYADYAEFIALTRGNGNRR